MRRQTRVPNVGEYFIDSTKPTLPAHIVQVYRVTRILQPLFSGGDRRVALENAEPGLYEIKIVGLREFNRTYVRNRRGGRGERVPKYQKTEAPVRR